MSDKEFPERIYVQMYPKLTNKALHLAAYESDPREAHDNGKPVYEYVSADLLAEAKREGEAQGIERALGVVADKETELSKAMETVPSTNAAKRRQLQRAHGAVVGVEIRLRELSPDPSYSERIKAEVWNTFQQLALEKAKKLDIGGLNRTRVYNMINNMQMPERFK